MERTRTVLAGAWRTLETFWNVGTQVVFFGPPGVEVKIRYGGWLFVPGWDSQRQTLDGLQQRVLYVSKIKSALRARVQAKSSFNTELTYTVITPGP